jgi:hypothetical protein
MSDGKRSLSRFRRDSRRSDVHAYSPIRQRHQDLYKLSLEWYNDDWVSFLANSHIDRLQSKNVRYAQVKKKQVLRYVPPSRRDSSIARGLGW